MHFRNLILLGTILILGSTQFGCFYDNEEDLFNISNNPNDTCGVVDISYSLDLVPLLDLECNNACHSSNIQKGGIILDSYADLIFHVDNGKLLGSIKKEDGFSPMPQGGELEKCEIALFEQWIIEGMKDN